MKNVKCENCAVLLEGWCPIKNDYPQPELVRDCDGFVQKTAHSIICDMTPEEMANWMFSILRNCHDCFLFRKGVCNSTTPCYETILKWLKSPVIK